MSLLDIAEYAIETEKYRATTSRRLSMKRNFSQANIPRTKPKSIPARLIA